MAAVHKHLRGGRAVAVHVLDVLFEGRIAVVNQRIFERAHGTGGLHGFVDGPLGKPRSAAAEEAQFGVGPVAAVAQRLARK